MTKRKHKPRRPREKPPMRDEGDLLDGPLGVADANAGAGTIMGHGD